MGWKSAAEPPESDRDVMVRRYTLPDRPGRYTAGRWMVDGVRDDRVVSWQEIPLRRYCLALVFDHPDPVRAQLVCLIRKNRPAWQAGRLNGAGGKLETGETAEQAVWREFHEEVGVELVNWREVVIMTDQRHYEVHCFASWCDPAETKTMTDEPVEWHRLDGLRLRDDLIGNVRWLIEMALAQDPNGKPVMVVTEPEA